MENKPGYFHDFLKTRNVDFNGFFQREKESLKFGFVLKNFRKSPKGLHMWIF